MMTETQDPVTVSDPSSNITHPSYPDQFMKNGLPSALSEIKAQAQSNRVRLQSGFGDNGANPSSSEDMEAQMLFTEVELERKPSELKRTTAKKKQFPSNKHRTSNNQINNKKKLRNINDSEESANEHIEKSNEKKVEKDDSLAEGKLNRKLNKLSKLKKSDKKSKKSLLTKHRSESASQFSESSSSSDDLSEESDPMTPARTKKESKLEKIQRREGFSLDELGVNGRIHFKDDEDQGSAENGTNGSKRNRRFRSGLKRVKQSDSEEEKGNQQIDGNGNPSELQNELQGSDSDFSQKKKKNGKGKLKAVKKPQMTTDELLNNLSKRGIIDQEPELPAEAYDSGLSAIVKMNKNKGIKINNKLFKGMVIEEQDQYDRRISSESQEEPLNNSFNPSTKLLNFQLTPKPNLTSSIVRGSFLVKAAQYKMQRGIGIKNNGLQSQTSSNSSLPNNISEKMLENNPSKQVMQVLSPENEIKDSQIVVKDNNEAQLDGNQQNSVLNANQINENHSLLPNNQISEQKVTNNKQEINLQQHQQLSSTEQECQPKITDKGHCNLLTNVEPSSHAQVDNIMKLPNNITQEQQVAQTANGIYRAKLASLISQLDFTSEAQIELSVAMPVVSSSSVINQTVFMLKSLQQDPKSVQPLKSMVSQSSFTSQSTPIAQMAQTISRQQGSWRNKLPTRKQLFSQIQMVAKQRRSVFVSQDEIRNCFKKTDLLELETARLKNEQRRKKAEEEEDNSDQEEYEREKKKKQEQKKFRELLRKEEEGDEDQQQSERQFEARSEGAEQFGTDRQNIITETSNQEDENAQNLLIEDEIGEVNEGDDMGQQEDEEQADDIEDDQEMSQEEEDENASHISQIMEEQKENIITSKNNHLILEGPISDIPQQAAAAVQLVPGYLSDDDQQPRRRTGLSKETVNRQEGYQFEAQQSSNVPSQQQSANSKDVEFAEFRKLRNIAQFIKERKRKRQETAKQVEGFVESEAELGSDNEQNDDHVRKINRDADDQHEDDDIDLDAELEQLIDNAVDINEQNQQLAFKKYLEDVRARDKEELRKVLRGEFRKRQPAKLNDEFEEDEKLRQERIDEVVRMIEEREKADANLYANESERGSDQESDNINYHQNRQNNAQQQAEITEDIERKLQSMMPQAFAPSLSAMSSTNITFTNVKLQPSIKRECSKTLFEQLQSNQVSGGGLKVGKSFVPSKKPVPSSLATLLSKSSSASTAVPVKLQQAKLLVRK